MSEDLARQYMDKMVDLSRDALIDGFAEFVSLINERNYEHAALAAHSLSYSLNLVSQGLATEALARRQQVDKPED